jgi:hypothetical protein
VFILQQTKYTIHESNQKVFYKVHKIIWVVINLGFARATERVRRGSAGWRRAGLDYGRRMAIAWLWRRTAGSGELRRRTATPATNDTSDERGELEREASLGRREKRESSAVPFYREQEGEKESARETSMASGASSAINGFGYFPRHQRGEQWGGRNGRSDDP